MQKTSRNNVAARENQESLMPTKTLLQAGPGPMYIPDG